MLKRFLSHQLFVVFFLVKCKFPLPSFFFFFFFDLPIEVILSAISFSVKSPVAFAVFYTTRLEEASQVLY